MAMAQGVSGSNNLIRCIVVSPEATVLETDAQFVALPLADGEIGIGPRHSPLIGRLGYGEMRIVEAGQTRSFYVDGGFVQVIDNVVSVRTGSAVPTDELDADLAAERLAEARKKPASGDEMIAIRERQVAQARAQLRLIRRPK